ncbi:MAG: acyl dehydratase [Acidimicrobiales bacterium]
MDSTGRRPSIRWDAFAVGHELPAMAIDVTATVIVAGAIASRDFMPVHHDQGYATGHGSPDIVMNILSDTAYCSRFLTDWAGPEAMVRRLAIRLGVPMCPGSLLSYTGTVTDRREADGEGVATVAFSAVNSLGEHLSGTADLAFTLT